MSVLGRATEIVGHACRLATGAFNRCSTKVCPMCRVAFQDGDRVRLVADGRWVGGKVQDVGAVMVHDPPCRLYAAEDLSKLDEEIIRKYSQ